MKIKSKIFILNLLVIACMFISCADANAAPVFHSLAQTTGKFAYELRLFAYALSGFGIIMFTYLAICGKINFKHLGYIMISLFMLSAMGALITYIKGGNTELTYNFHDTYVQAISSNAGKITTKNH